jgi:nitrous oxidase accessory protein NosD
LSKTLQATVPGGGRLSFIGVRAGSSGAIISDLNFDYNGTLLTDASFRSYNAVRSNGKNVLIERIRAINAPGRNVVVGTNAVTLRASIFTNSNQNIPGNTLANDASFVYLNGADNLVEDNVFSNDAPAVSNSGGVEVHATNSKVLRNRFINLYPAIYDGVQDGTMAKNNQIIGNFFSNCRGGVHSADQHRGWTITDNLFIDANLPPFFAIMTPRDDSSGVTSAGIQQDVTIQNNTFETVNSDPQRPYIAIAGFQNSIIRGNNFNGNAIPLALLVSTTETKNVVISDNVFVDPPDSIYSYGQVHLSGDNNGSWGGVFRDVLVKNNRFMEKRSLGKPVNIYPLATSGSGALTFTNISAVDTRSSI